MLPSPRENGRTRQAWLIRIDRLDTRQAPWGQSWAPREARGRRGRREGKLIRRHAIVLKGAGGKDFLHGGPQRDVCNGGPGKDKDKAKACEKEKNIP